MTRTVIALLLLGLLVGCSGHQSGGAPTPVDPPSAATAPSPDAPAVGSGSARERVPDAPSAGLAALADELDRAEATLRVEDPMEREVRRAGEYIQLAVRVLDRAPGRFRRGVIRRLDPAAAAATRANLRAASGLRSITDPRTDLPDWRIVTPPQPARLRAYYRAAGRRTGIAWAYFAAIHLVETRMGRIRGTSTAGARGPMQFLPATWDIYGAGGDINDPRDAILAAGRLLVANGAPADMAGALWHYNPSRSYVRAVTTYAGLIRRDPRAYRGYWHWRVLYRHVDGTYVLPEGYPRVRPVLLDAQRQRTYPSASSTSTPSTSSRR